jgi:serine/threonine protein phosphatase PrpC
MCQVWSSLIYIRLSYVISCYRFAADDLPTNIISCLRNGNDCAESLFRGYLKTDEDFLRDAYNKAGCTATVLLFDHSCGVISVANTGDTRAVVSRLHTAIDITRDMKATDPLEVARIVKGGGHIANGRVLGSLAIARAIGDKNLKDSPTNSLIPDPEVTSFSVTPDDEFIVIATDGLWDVMSSQVSIWY